MRWGIRRMGSVQCNTVEGVGPEWECESAEERAALYDVRQNGKVRFEGLSVKPVVSPNSKARKSIPSKRMMMTCGFLRRRRRNLNPLCCCRDESRRFC